MRVEIWSLRNGEDVLEGAFIREGGTIRAELDDPSLRELLERPVRDPKTGKQVSAEDDPETFLRSLKFTYRSAYLRASDPL